MDRAVRPGFLLVAAGLAGLAAVAASFAVVPPDRAAGPRWGVPLFWASLAAILVGGWVANRVLRRVWEATDVSTNREA